MDCSLAGREAAAVLQCAQSTADLDVVKSRSEWRADSGVIGQVWLLEVFAAGLLGLDAGR